MLGTSGNLSALITEPTNLRVNEPMKNFEFLITASGKDKGELKEDDFILVNENGVIARSEATKQSPLRTHEAEREVASPSAETLLHSTIYKQTSSNAVFHVHTTNSTLLSVKSKTHCIVFSDLEMLKGLGFKTHDVTISIPVIENSQDMKYLADIIPNYINGQVPGLILRGHGIYAWGKTVQETKRHIEIFEFLFDYKLKELSLSL